jgi:hypothetical protein
VALLTAACSGDPQAPSELQESAQHSQQSQPSPQPGTVDTLDFVVGDATLWPRVGSQQQYQVVDMVSQQVCWTKYGQSGTYECWRWDADYIYHEQDHALDGDSSGRSYHFTDGRWLPRHLRPGELWTLDLPGNQIVNLSADCQVAAPARFPYRVTAQLLPAQPISSDLGTRPVLVLDYTPYDRQLDPSHTERFYFAQGAGWYRWESSRGVASFDRLGGSSVLPALSCL